MSLRGTHNLNYSVSSSHSLLNSDDFPKFSFAILRKHLFPLNDFWLIVVPFSLYLDDLETTGWFCFLRKLWRVKTQEFCKRNLNITQLYETLTLI